jgi:hypothetical protein
MAGRAVGEDAPPDVGTSDSTGAVGVSAPAAVQQSVARQVRLTYQRTQKLELTLGGKIADVFMPGDSKVVDDWIINHPDFPAYADQFSVQEVK